MKELVIVYLLAAMGITFTLSGCGSTEYNASTGQYSFAEGTDEVSRVLEVSAQPSPGD